MVLWAGCKGRQRSDRANLFQTYIFNIGARVNGDDIAVLHTEVVADNTVDAGTSVIEIIIGQDNQHSVLALLALDQDCVTTEELESLHGVVGKRDNGVVIVDGIGHTVMDELSVSHQRGRSA